MKILTDDTKKRLLLTEQSMGHLCCVSLGYVDNEVAMKFSGDKFLTLAPCVLSQWQCLLISEMKKLKTDHCRYLIASEIN